jgi:hypothetical protein
LSEFLDAEQGIFTLAATIEPADGDNVIFTSGAIRDNSSKYKQFVLAGYGIHWPAKNQVDTGGRFAEFPVTLFRAQMYAIIEALKLVCLFFFELFLCNKYMSFLGRKTRAHVGADCHGF